MALIKKTFQYGEHSVTLETGEIARHADGAVLVNMGDTVVMVTACAKKTLDGWSDFLPLTIDYQERTYAAGRIPGGFFRREGRPSEKEILTARLCDRPLRPVFPKGFTHETQIIATVMSSNPDVDPEIPTLIGASAALAVSGIPFNGPVGAARVGYVNGEYVLNPSNTQLKESKLDLVVAGTEDAILMVESEANELTEEVMLGSVLFGHEQSKIAIQAIRELGEEVNPPEFKWVSNETPPELIDIVTADCAEEVAKTYTVAGKMERNAQLDATRARLIETYSGGKDAKWLPGEVAYAMTKVQKSTVRHAILDGKPRIDGRDIHTVRPISIRTGLLPRAHGSALFTRGETQTLVATTLGTNRDAQIIDALEGERKDHFMLHYNFPPYSIGEVGRVAGGPKRREIGHGRLAKRGVIPVLPDNKDFPYAIRLVSEVTESNGSSSMASVCGSSLALMDAGVPVKAPVAGVAMGLIKEGERFAVLTDIMGDEDFIGDMDFKIAGTAEGINALQMDIKINGITEEIMRIALDQAKVGRIHVLGEMAKAISEPREEMSEFAPQIIRFKINPDKVREVIGKGGSTIRSIAEASGAKIDIDDHGVVKVAATDRAAAMSAKKRIEEITAEVEVGAIYEGKVAKIMDFGAFVTIMPGRDGLVHISQIANERVDKVTDKLSEGDVIKVKVLDNKQGRISLSMKAVHEDD